jgi:pentapeptide MXKDX repeat protein
LWLDPATLVLGGGGSMIKSELILRVAAQNQHLYNRDVEKVVNTIFDEIEAAATLGLAIAFAPAAFAADDMKKDTMTKDSMSKDKMDKDKMDKDSMSKDSMKKDSMKKDDMKK